MPPDRKSSCRRRSPASRGGTMTHRGPGGTRAGIPSMLAMHLDPSPTSDERGPDEHGGTAATQVGGGQRIDVEVDLEAVDLTPGTRCAAPRCPPPPWGAGRPGRRTVSGEQDRRRRFRTGRPDRRSRQRFEPGRCSASLRHRGGLAARDDEASTSASWLVHLDGRRDPERLGRRRRGVSTAPRPGEQPVGVVGGYQPRSAQGGLERSGISSRGSGGSQPRLTLARMPGRCGWWPGRWPWPAADGLSDLKIPSRRDGLGAELHGEGGVSGDGEPPAQNMGTRSLPVSWISCTRAAGPGGAWPSRTLGAVGLGDLADVAGIERRWRTASRRRCWCRLALERIMQAPRRCAAAPRPGWWRRTRTAR